MKIDTPTLKTSYSLGLDMGANLIRLPIDIDIAAVLHGIEDAFLRKEPAISREEFLATMQEFQTRMQTMQAEMTTKVAGENKEKGESYLAENAKKNGIIVTEGGVQIEILTMGEGAKPEATNTIKVHYKGCFIDGNTFDSSYDRGEPIEFPLNQVIPGWQEAFQEIPVGSMAKITIPPAMAYGSNGNGPIPPESVLIFDVELLDIVK